MSDQTQPPVLLRVENGLGRITLNRPRSINALDHEMVQLITPVLADWASDPEVRAVLLDGAGERGLCAGGDIKAIHASAVEGTDRAADYWREEYLLDIAIAEFPKPFVALMDGIVMGGGVGVGGHASHRVVTERSRIGMPEVGIGFVPDVGGTYLLARAPGQTGLHLALTGGSMTGADAIAIGFADFYVPSDQLPALVDALVADPSAVDAAIAAVAVAPPASALLDQQDWIDRAYAADTPAEILSALDAAPEPEAAKAAAALRAVSPTSVTAALRMVRQAAALDLSLRAAINVEYAVAVSALRFPDIAEGIRAQVIDKDRNPRWSPASFDEVPDLASWFALPADIPFPDDVPASLRSPR